jgi:hypothetical protein
VPEASPPPKAEGQDGADPTSKKSAFNWDELGLPGAVLAAVAGGLGVLGFVAFFGAAILWVRMDEAGLPGNDAVAVVPKSVLIATGASFLIPALLIALGFTVILYLVDSGTTWYGQKSTRALENELSEERLAEEARHTRALRRGEAVQTALKSAEESRDKIAAAVAAEAMPAEEKEKAEAQLQSICEQMKGIAEDKATAEKRLLEQQARIEIEERQGCESISRFQWWATVAATVALFVLGTIAVIAVYRVDLTKGGRILVLLLLAALLTTVCLVVRMQTKHFGWLAVVAFVAVGLMIGGLTYYRTVDDSKIEPAALLRAHGAPVRGFYVAQTSDRIYLGTKPHRGVARLDSIPRAEVVSLVVGDLQSPAEAEAEALAFALQLCRRAREREATGLIADKGGAPGEEVSSGCTAADLGRLKAAAAG